jgi:molybdate transport system regulatory protein
MPIARHKKPKGIAVRGDLSLTRDGQNFLGGSRIALLESIAIERSITKAAKRVGLSYKGAWDAVDAMNNISPQPLVVRTTGGVRGGGTMLTDYGREVVQLYRQLESGQRRVLSGLEKQMHDVERLSGLVQAISLRTSARNQYGGTIRRLRKGAVNAEVVLDLGDDMEIVASITNEAVADLELAKGKAAYALIKSSFVLLTTTKNMRISARNQLQGKVSEVVRGSVNSEVKLALAGARTLTAIVTNESVTNLGLKKGVGCTALIKASHVLIAVNG